MYAFILLSRKSKSTATSYSCSIHWLHERRQQVVFKAGDLMWKYTHSIHCDDGVASMSTRLICQAVAQGESVALSLWPTRLRCLLVPVADIDARQREWAHLQLVTPPSPRNYEPQPAVADNFKCTKSFFSIRLHLGDHCIHCWWSRNLEQPSRS